MGAMSYIKMSRAINEGRYVKPYSELDSLEKREHLFLDIKELLNSISDKNGIGGDAFNVLCFGSFLTESYLEGSDIDLLVCAEQYETVLKIARELSKYLDAIGMIYDIVPMTLKTKNAIALEAIYTHKDSYKNNMPECFNGWFAEMRERWGDYPMIREKEEKLIELGRFKEYKKSRWLS